MKALIIDDNKDITDPISIYLEGSGIYCKVINQGKEGLEAIKKGDFDIIILDLAMPEYSGYDIFNVLKKEEMVKTKNIVIFTASSLTNEDVNEMLRTGAKAVLKKPLSIEELAETIDRFRPAK